MDQNEILKEICQAVVDGEKEAAESWANKALQKKSILYVPLKKG